MTRHGEPPASNDIVGSMDVDALIHEAGEALESYEYKTALRLGKRLLKARHSYGYEVLARAHAGLDEPEKAIAVLEEGLKKADVWPLWHLLGQIVSDEGDHERALACYERALSFQDAHASVIQLNAAIDLGRAGRHEEALARLALVDDPLYAIELAIVRARTLNVLGRHGEALEVARAALANEELERDQRADLQSIAAFALWSAGDRDSAWREVWDAIATKPSTSDALWLVREIENVHSPETRPFRIKIEGPWPNEQAEGFLAIYDVFADDENEALQFIRRCEPEAIRDAIRIRSAEAAKEKRPDLPKGVYWRSGTVIYGGEDAE